MSFDRGVMEYDNDDLPDGYRSVWESLEHALRTAKLIQKFVHQCYFHK